MSSALQHTELTVKSAREPIENRLPHLLRGPGQKVKWWTIWSSAVGPSWAHFERGVEDLAVQEPVPESTVEALDQGASQFRAELTTSNQR